MQHEHNSEHKLTYVKTVISLHIKIKKNLKIPKMPIENIKKKNWFIYLYVVCTLRTCDENTPFFFIVRNKNVMRIHNVVTSMIDYAMHTTTRIKILTPYNLIYDTPALFSLLTCFLNKKKNTFFFLEKQIQEINIHKSYFYYRHCLQ